MSITIEKGIAVPPKPVRGGQYPFGQLEVGDSFVVPRNGHKSWAFVFTAINSAQNKHSIKLTSRLIDNDHRRVWRTE